MLVVRDLLHASLSSQLVHGLTAALTPPVMMLAAGRTFAERVWAIEGCNGIGKHLAHRLVHDGEMVLDVPPRLSAQVLVFATGNGRTPCSESARLPPTLLDRLLAPGECKAVRHCSVQ